MCCVGGDNNVRIGALRGDGLARSQLFPAKTHGIPASDARGVHLALGAAEHAVALVINNSNLPPVGDGGQSKMPEGR